ncbi:P-loop ATPase, Sll1717 family [Ralstonia insidiosa]|uniref:ATPase n=1 Tax=Ralstonia insidiosa TaxID=190721 RepID=A0A848NVJ0_9RALS|nr:hypothetical protein [Ralstonia insidiosa]NMV36496.1 hypothetical protein [Ralstonia insidiosa]
MNAANSTTADVQLKLNDKSLFGNDAGEDENIEVLASYFVNQDSFDDFLDDSVRLQVARGRKGMGKSALLSKFAYELSKTDSKPLIVQVVPSNLSGLQTPPATQNHGILENYWKQVICQSINYEMAKAIGFAWKDDQITLVDGAEIAGFKGKNIIGALASRLLGKVNLFGSIEFKYGQSGIQNNEQLLKRIQEEGSDARQVWFLLDDIDSKFQNTPEQKAYISSFFSACRTLIREIQGISIRATVRTDVWTSLRDAEDLDKFEQYVCDIDWNASQQKDILVKRIYAYVMRRHAKSYVAKNWTMDKHPDDIIELAFTRRMTWGNSGVPPVHVLRILAAGRPRWMAQLCKLAGLNATKKNKNRIGIGEINEAMDKFGVNRLSDLYKEHNHQFSDLQKLIESFSGGERRYSTDDLMKKIMGSFIKNRGAGGIADVDGEPFRDSWQIAHFLFKCGFIVGHKSVGSPEFVTYAMRPDLLQVATNLDDGMIWEIQPSYRTVLKIK